MQTFTRNDPFKKIDDVVTMLREHYYEVTPVMDLTEAKQEVLKELPENCSISMGGSVTLDQMEMVETVRNGNWVFFDRYKKDITWPERVEVMRQGAVSGCVFNLGQRYYHER